MSARGDLSGPLYMGAKWQPDEINFFLDAYRNEVLEEAATKIRTASEQWDMNTSTGRKRYWAYQYAADLIDPAASQLAKRHATGPIVKSGKGAP